MKYCVPSTSKDAAFSKPACTLLRSGQITKEIELTKKLSQTLVDPAAMVKERSALVDSVRDSYTVKDNFLAGLIIEISSYIW